MRHGSLFSGIGGFDLAAEWMGWGNVFHCEWNPFGKRILKYYWPNAISYEDITKTDFTVHRGQIDILTGGFPCQPFSTAGKRQGKEDDRYLWPEMLRAINEIRPTWIVGENVAGLKSMGIEQSLSEMEGGETSVKEEIMVIEQIREDLEKAGYELQPFIIPACAVNAPHRRDRIWFIALQRFASDSADDGSCGDKESKEGCNIQRSRIPLDGIKSLLIPRITANTNSNQRCQGRMPSERSEATERHFSTFDACSYERRSWVEFPTQTPVCNGDDGISSELDGITFSKWRTESIKAGGNAIVPQVVHQIFKAIEAYENQNP